MITINKFLLGILVCIMPLRAVYAQDSQQNIPSVEYAQFFHDVVSCDSLFGDGGVFRECKTMVDIEPREDTHSIVEAYKRLPSKKTTSVLKNFLLTHFVIPEELSTSADKDDDDIDTHIMKLWGRLQRQPRHNESGTLLPLNYTYFIPGGRFREMYYWDSYFSMLGMYVDHQYDLLEKMVENFADIINRIGFVPNGMRTYYLGRSQPPYFSKMVELLSKVQGERTFVKYLPAMLREYDFWMSGSDSLSPSRQACQHTVLMPDGTVLNRYFDKYDTPRDEMYRKDVATAGQLLMKNPHADVWKLWRDLRAAAESGFDFSSRWMTDVTDLTTTHTTDFVAIDINVLLYCLEKNIAKAYAISGDSQKQRELLHKAENRKKALNKYCWNEAEGFFFDYIYTEKRLSDKYSLAGVYPLYEKMANDHQAERARKVISRIFLKSGGVVTTPYHTEQQWDAPNGWAPLQWVTYNGLLNYGFQVESSVLRMRWLSLVEQVYKDCGKILEKYNVEGDHAIGGGEYPNQEGFGWTNGVYRAMKAGLKLQE